jgi:hypothetical protein
MWLHNERHLIDETPGPVLARLQGSDDRVITGGGMLARVAIR